jgi:hypothetical protein
MLDFMVWVMSLLEEMYKDGVHRLDARENLKFFYSKCNVSLCIQCFAPYHIKQYKNVEQHFCEARISSLVNVYIY